MKIVQTYEFEKYANWNAEIFRAIQKFIENHNVAPNILLTNSWTSERLDGLIAVELFEKGHVDYMQMMSVFSCSLADLECCLEEQLSKHQFELVFDDEAEFIDPANEKNFEGGYSYAA